MKNKKQFDRKFSLNKETIAQLDQEKVKGGYTYPCASNPCACDTSDDPITAFKCTIVTITCEFC
jgi:hypothetical protein